jgi:hypothetical protein
MEHIGGSQKDYKELIEAINNLRLQLQNYELKTDLFHDVLMLFVNHYTNTQFDSMTNFVTWLDSIYEKQVDLNDDIKTALDNGITEVELVNCQNFNDAVKAITDLNSQVKQLLTSYYSSADYLTMTGLNTYLKYHYQCSVSIFGETTQFAGQYFQPEKGFNPSFEANSYKYIYFVLPPTATDNNSFHHIILWQLRDPNITSGLMKNYLNFLPNSSANNTPVIYKIGVNHTWSNDEQWKIHIYFGGKHIEVRFDTIGAAGNNTSQACLINLKAIGPNFNGFINGINSQNPYGNPYRYDILAYANTTNNVIWDSSDVGCYNFYDWDEAPTQKNIYPKKYTNGTS